ncbi:GMC family oxidoreductase N-terminal domain-containing protein [Actinomadura sp. CNU-125]|uniref:GMC family oxidoreductase N-terminal domain-containing protein n=1 Tax=Actinomadura sp. CNU-125 TaxID=1904961 RepID=UPI0021CC74A9|nr:GMC family oxidoreductase N-terminal domain-containing protein [Actinomadura sp. CNU-125]
MADLPRRPRPALRRRREDDGRDAVPAGPGAVPRHPEDARDAGRRGGARAALRAAPAGDQLRRPAGRDAGRRPDDRDPEYGNLHGVPRRTCKLCGECDIGCNEGSKNSLDHTYLSAAAHHGADIRTSREVKALRPRPGGGYEVDYVHHDDLALKRKARQQPVRTITCDRLILGGGTYGTTLLLLKSRTAFPGLSGALGSRFSGNGDLLTFLLTPATASASGRWTPPAGR